LCIVYRGKGLSKSDLIIGIEGKLHWIGRSFNTSRKQLSAIGDTIILSIIDSDNLLYEVIIAKNEELLAYIFH